MEGEFQDHGQLHQDLEEGLSPRGSQCVHGFFSEYDKQQSIHIENLDTQGEIMSNQYLEGGTSTMIVIKWSEKVEGYGDNIYSPLCDGIYKE